MRGPKYLLERAHAALRAPFRASGGTRWLTAMAALIGLSAGVVTYLLEWGLRAVEDLFFHGFQDLAARPLAARWPVLLIPAAGGLLLGITLRLGRSEEGFHGVVEVLHALLKRGGEIPLVKAFVRGFGTILTVGFGGSGGPEAPIVHMGAAIGSAVGRWGEVPADLLKVLIAAGAAGGVGAAFNAPLAGVVFSLEVILVDFAAHAFSLVVIASVTASVVARFLLGGAAYFTAPVFGLGSPGELALYAALGLGAGFLGKGFMGAMSQIERVLEHPLSKIPRWLRPAAGGLLVGLTGFFLPQVLSSGHEGVQSAIDGRIPIALCLLLIPMKVLATGLTLESGGSGGVFLPVLFVGALFGEALGLGARLWFPSIQPGAYALGGMAAVFAAAFHSPITAILVLFETTRDYQLILPFMLASVLASLISHRLHPESLNTLRLARLGIRRPPAAAPANPLEHLTVAEVMTASVESLPQDASLDRLTQFIERSRHTGFPVVDAAGRVVGLVTYADVHQCFSAGELSAVIVKDIMREDVPSLLARDSVAEALRLMQAHGLDRLPVLDGAESRRLAGIVSQSDVLAAHKKLARLGPPHADAPR